MSARQKKKKSKKHLWWQKNFSTLGEKSAYNLLKEPQTTAELQMVQQSSAFTLG